MKISFKTKKIENLCNKRDKAIRELGNDCSDKLQLRLSQLSSIEFLEDMKYGNPHPLKGNKKGQFSISLEGGFRLVFEAIKPIPKTSDNAIFWQKVTVINIVFIGDYHE
ncbi:type II toxin-antitoxin system RelE/ParE family toxin [Bathymodiolus thermophilus thioautotrophic gill symbiont]|uniref:Killer suppression protein HigA n=1 Tax=Bathymodiolus thermophilus thioautotrophic gill symbiont TaxID=2360 RepID=A0A1J5TX11_9GAMM|nr:hypothetical protein [Bathymodiolus thermophilus thioautotrophic gill symbiont]OIR25290.1 hypothetical protein BGC33_06055 [Bathymodiolus thermophilus thioautotrophic gill symbiont]